MDEERLQKGGILLRPEKIHRPQSGLNLRPLDLEVSTLPRQIMEIVNELCTNCQRHKYITRLHER